MRPWLKEVLIAKLKRSSDTMNKSSSCFVQVVWFGTNGNDWPRVHWLFLGVAEIWEIAYY